MATARFDVARKGSPAHHRSSARDLASAELWDRSLARSRQRRRLTEIGRRSRRRKKSASLAMSAALAAAPVLPRGVAAADSGSGPAVAGSTDGPGASLLQTTGSRVVLRFGSQGGLVAAAQERLNRVLPLMHLAVDGIYGPLTRGAVVDFQRHNGLTLTGSIDARMWAAMFNAPVLILDQPGGSSASPVAEVSSAHDPAARASAPLGTSRQRRAQLSSVGGHGEFVATAGPTGRSPAAAGGGASQPAVTPAAGGSAAAAPGVAVITPSAPTVSAQTSTYVLTDGVALPLPRGYLVNGYVDQGVDYSAPGGTPEYAMGDGVIVGEGISGFGPNAPVLEITSGPLKGLQVYYGHAGSNLVHVGQRVRAGQQITEVGYGIVGISTGPHLEVGVYPPGGNGAGYRMLGIINGLLAQHSSGRTWGTRAVVATAARATSHGSAGATTAAHRTVPVSTARASVHSSAAAKAPVSSRAKAAGSPEPQAIPAQATTTTPAQAAAATTTTPAQAATTTTPAQATTTTPAQATTTTPAQAAATTTTTTPVQATTTTTTPAQAAAATTTTPVQAATTTTTPAQAAAATTTTPAQAAAATTTTPAQAATATTPAAAPTAGSAG
ncbi:MAG: peptidoglycan-binding protein [Solirubrobacteraceae bacterium]